VASQNQLFRQSALKKLSSPDKLDIGIPLLRSFGWMAVFGAGGIIAAALFWGVLGTYRVMVNGEGLLKVDGSAFVDILAPKSGWVEYAADVGRSIKKGQLVAKLNAPEAAGQLSAALEAKEQLDAQRKDVELRYSARIEAERTAHAQRRAGMEESIRLKSAQVADIESQLRNREHLLTTGASTVERVQEARERLNAVRESLSRSKADLKELDGAMLALMGQRAQEIETLERQLQQARGQIHVARLGVDLATQVYAEVSGRVVAAAVVEHSLISSGKKILTIETEGSGLEVLAFFPPDQGKNIEIGMPARVVPSNVRKEEFGALVGRVVAVSPLPASSDTVSALLANEDLSRQFSKAGPPLVVRIALVPDPTSQNDYRWTSSRGQTVTLSSGMLGSVSVIVRESPPITLVVPALRGIFG
jgi:HlyD family secretion protein